MLWSAKNGDDNLVMAFPIKKRINTDLFILIKGQHFAYKRVQVKIRAKEKRVKSWAPKNNNRWKSETNNRSTF